MTQELAGYWTAGLLDQRGARTLYAVGELLDPSAAEVAAQGEDTEPLTARLRKPSMTWRNPPGCPRWTTIIPSTGSRRDGSPAFTMPSQRPQVIHCS